MIKVKTTDKKDYKIGEKVVISPCKDFHYIKIGKRKMDFNPPI